MKFSWKERVDFNTLIISTFKELGIPLMYKDQFFTYCLSNQDSCNILIRGREEEVKKLISNWQKYKRGSKMKNWRDLNKTGATFNLTKNDIDIPELERYKTDNKKEIPNNAKFTGDKPPANGNSSKAELDAWRSQNKEYEKAKKKEDKGGIHGSPIVDENSRYEDLDEKIKDEHVLPDVMGGKIKHSWRETFADMSFKKKPDGTLEVNVTENNTTDDNLLQPPLNNQVPPQPIQEETVPEKEASTKVREWEIKKEGNFKLIGKECNTHAGIGIYKKGEELEFHKLAKKGHKWNELIPQGLWETKFDEVVANGK